MNANETIDKNEEVGRLAASALGNSPERTSTTVIIPNFYRNTDNKAYTPTGHEAGPERKEHPEIETTGQEGLTGTEIAEDTIIEHAEHEKATAQTQPQPETSEPVKPAGTEATTDATTQTPEESQRSSNTTTEQAIGDQDRPNDKKTRYAYACVVCPFDNDSPLLEEKITRAWKEYSDVNFPGRILRFVAQAYDTKARRFCGDPVDIQLVPNDLSHGSVPGRTIGITGFLVENPDTPNADDGGLHPADSIGWTHGQVWVSIAFDLYDQIGHVIGYSNDDGNFSLPLSGVSTALGLQPMAPISEPR